MSFGTLIVRVYMAARMMPSTWRSCMACSRARSSSGSPSVSPMNNITPRSRAASRAPLIMSPARREVATVSETKPIVRVVPVRSPMETAFGR